MADPRPKGLEDGGVEPSVEELRREQRREASHATLAHTQGQLRGAFFGAVAFGLLGLVLGTVVGLVVFDADSPARFVVPAVVTVFSAWVGVVFWGGRTPEITGETRTIYGEPEDGTSERPEERPAPGT
jgi:hypothetical protein